MKRIVASRTNAALNKHILFLSPVLFLAPVLFNGCTLFVREIIFRREYIAASGTVYDSSIRAAFYRAE